MTNGVQSTGWRSAAVLAAALNLLVAGAWSWTTVSAEDAMVRLRNSLGARVGEPADFAWTPGNAPAGFLQLETAAPAAFTAVAGDVEERRTGPGGELEAGLAYSRRLMQAPRRVDGPVRAPSYETYLAIVREGRGYCADFVKAFTGIAAARGIAVRQWGFAFRGFGSGHTFNEVYDTGLGKWVMVDSFHSLYFVDPASRMPLSTLEVHDRLLAIGDAPAGIEIVRIAPSGFPFRSDELALDYYRRGMAQLWMVWGNNVFDYEASLGGWLEARVHRALGQFVGIVSGDYPTIRIYPVGLSDRDYRLLVESRTQFAWSACALVIAVLFALYVAMRLRRTRRRPT